MLREAPEEPDEVASLCDMDVRVQVDEDGTEIDRAAATAGDRDTSGCRWSTAAVGRRSTLRFEGGSAGRPATTEGEMK